MTVKVGIIGMGFMGRMHLASYMIESTEITMKIVQAEERSIQRGGIEKVL
jgi:predicted dehydrogenase